MTIFACKVHEINQPALCRMLHVKPGVITVGRELRDFFVKVEPSA